MSETKVCNICGQKKTLDQYSWRNKKRGTKQGYCKDCHREYRRQHYLANHEKYKDMQKVWNDANAPDIRESNRRYIFEYLLEHPCVDCGESNPLVLEFDHVRGKKRFSISSVMNSTYRIETIQKEIDKCEVRCANCHRRKTAQEWDWKILDIIAEVRKEKGF